MHPSIKTPDEIAVYKKITLIGDMKLMYEFGYHQGCAETSKEALSVINYLKRDL